MRATLACALVLAGCVSCINAVHVKKGRKNHAVAPHAAAAAAVAEAKTVITISCAVVPFVQCTVYARICSLMHIENVLLYLECVLLQMAPFAECTVDAGKNSQKSHS
jgi:hypothetical protein